MPMEPPLVKMAKAILKWSWLATARKKFALVGGPDAENLAQLTEFARVLRPGGALLLDLAGRLHLERATRGLGDAWYDTGEGYRERVRWSTDRRRILTDRLCRGVRFRHDIWIPTAEEVLAFSEEAGFRLEACWGGLAGEPWRPGAPRWIYRFKREARG